VKKPLVFILLSLLLATSAWLVESKVFHSELLHSDISKFKRHFSSAEKTLNQNFEQICSTPITALDNQTEKYNSLFEKKRICFFVIQNKKVTYWTDNRVVLPQNTNELKDKSLVKLPAGWFYCRISGDSATQHIGLLLLKSTYSINNKFIQNKFNTSFALPNEVHLYQSSLGKTFDIVNADSKFIFSLIFPNNVAFTQSEVHIPIVLYAISFILFLLFLSYIVKIQKSTRNKIIALSAEAIILLITRQLLLFSNFPHAFYQLELFNPKLFAYSNFFPSLGEVAIFSVIIIYIVSVFYFYIPIKQAKNDKSLKIWLIRISLISVAIILFFYTIWLFNSLILNSSICFEANKIMHITFSSILGILIITAYFGLIYLLIEKTLKTFSDTGSYKRFILLFLSTFLAITILFFLLKLYLNWSSILIFSVVVIGGSYLYLIKHLKHNYLVINALTLAFAIFATCFIHSISEQKRDEEQKVIALRLATERDPVAENLLAEMRSNLQNDTIIQHLINDLSFNFDVLMPYLRQQYFNGYFEKYDFQLTVCRSDDSLRISPEDINVPCFSFFNSMLGTKGERLHRSDFYYVNYANSRISYLGILRYQTTSYGLTHIYIELDSRLNLQELGYPDLLLDNKLARQQLNENYSFARYYKGNLIAQTGKYPYNRTTQSYTVNKQEFSTSIFKGYKHLFYKSNKDNLLLISRPNESISDILISFSYLFVFLLVIFNTVLFFVYIKQLKSFIVLNFEHRIRYSLTGMLLFSLLLVAGASAIYTSRQFKQRHNAQISEKMQSIYREMAQRLGFEEQKDANFDNLSQQNTEVMLRSFSNIFYSDINIYNPQGVLIASSRPEIFSKNFVSTLLNREAFKELSQNNRSEYVHYEAIGSMRYMSAYMPMVNADGTVIGYLNLPYFAKQNELWAELYNQLFTLLNFYILLMLVAISFSVLISRRITQPLRWLQDRFSQIKLGDRTSKIDYKGKDEIGALIEQYNRMVEELNRNMDLLAKSERESAWREMAKQIAHEIKNPLTPMKLSLQHLVRAWNDKVENWDEHLNRVTQTIIEQIDNLTAIANEFSNFAKMPKPNTIRLSVSSIVNDVVQLYSGSDTLIKYNKHTKNEPEILADKEQISRVFINIITNSLQAIPPRKKGRINIDIFDKDDDTIKIEISDNGAGIAPAISGKLFEPNFTTKSGGMGLGLAIVKSIVETAGGSIYFRSILNEGSTFTIELPLAKENKVESELE
jgi:signal transduction histidine kinase